MQCLDPDFEFLFSPVLIGQLLFLVGNVGVLKVIDAGDGSQKLTPTLKPQLSLSGFKHTTDFRGVIQRII